MTDTLQTSASSEPTNTDADSTATVNTQKPQANAVDWLQAAGNQLPPIADVQRTTTAEERAKIIRVIQAARDKGGWETGLLYLSPESRAWVAAANYKVAKVTTSSNHPLFAIQWYPEEDVAVANDNVSKEVVEIESFPSRTQ
jgi:hypothetical protein